MQHYLRELLLNYMVHNAHKHGKPLTVVKGTKTREVTKARLLAEQKVLEDGELSKPIEIIAVIWALGSAERAKGQKWGTW